MTDLAEFFFSAPARVVLLDTLEISHPDFSRTYRLVRNAPNGIGTGTGGLAWEFDGVDDEVLVGDVLDKDRTDTFSAFGWVRTTDSGTQAVIGKAADGNAPGWRMLMNIGGAGKVRLAMIGSDPADTLGVDGATAIPLDGSRHFVGFSKTTSPDASGVTVWIDGVAVVSEVATDDLDTSSLNSEPLKIGARGNGGFFDGEIGNVSVWSRALTSLEVAEIYAGGTPPDLSEVSFSDALEAWWVLDETDTDATDGVVDRSGNDLHGSANFEPTGALGPAEYEYCPMRVLPVASTDDMVQALSITLGDVGSIIAAEIENVWAANGMGTRPTLTYRGFRSDDLETPVRGPLDLELVSVTTTKEGCSFEARAPETNASRTGELYTIERFPMLRGFT